MRRTPMRAAVAAIAVSSTLSLVAGCDAGPTARPIVDALAPGSARRAAGGQISLAQCSPEQGGFTTISTNRYFPMDVGRQWILEGQEDDTPVRLQITMLDRLRVIGGVTTRVKEEREWEDGELLEVSWNYIAQSAEGSICYFGEDVDIFEDGGISHEGAWCASTPGNRSGILMPADPRPGMKFQMEHAPGVAEDEGQIVGVGPVEVPVGQFSDAIRVRESNPLDGDKGYKVYVADVGLVVDEVLELVAMHQTSGAPDEPVLSGQSCGK